MLEPPVRSLLLPCRSNNVKNMENQQGGIMIEYTKEDLLYLYEKFGSVRRVAKELSIPKSTLNYYFNQYGIKVDRRADVTKARLKKLLKEFQSVSRIAEELGLSTATVYNLIKRYDIDLNKFRSRFPYTKDELIKLHEECGSITKVAAKLSVSYSTVRYWYNSLDIITNPSGMTIFQELRQTPMNSLHKSVLIGSMLGDGGMWLAPHSKNARLYIRHCERQLGYLRWVHKLLQPFSRPIKLTEKAGEKQIGDRTVKNSNFYSFYTIAHPDVTAVYKNYYKDGYKYVDNNIINDVDLLAMSIWFGDDGCIQRNKKGYPSACSLSTNSFSYKEQLILVEALRKFFGGTIKIKPQGGLYKGVKRKDYIISMSHKEEVNNFLNIIKSILPECIHYKLS